MCRGINYSRGLFDEESSAAASNCVRFGGEGDGTGGRMERVARWRSIDKLSRCGDVVTPGFGEGNNIRGGY